MVEQKALAFRHEFYEEAKRHQIEDDLVSYLGEYRFEVSEFNYRLGIVNGILTDPNTDEPMSSKAKRAIGVKRRDGLNSSREEADLEGFINLEKGLSERPFGTVVWFSPPGPCDYGFAFVGKRNGNELEMTAIRLEKPKISDFNKTTDALWGKKRYEKAEDLLREPKVIDVPLEKVKEFIHGNFEINSERTKTIFKKALDKLDGIIKEVATVIKNGTSEQKRAAFYTIENLAIEEKEKLEANLKENVVFMSGRRVPQLSILLTTDRYTAQPKPVAGSCGSSAAGNNGFKSNSILNLGSSLENIFLEEDEFGERAFECPSCGETNVRPKGKLLEKCQHCGSKDVSC